MNSPAVGADTDVISKGEFARRRGVSPGRVSQWLSAKKIHGDAIVGQGREAQIRESVAVEQLRRNLDPMQMAGNGLTTNLTAALAPTANATTAEVLPFAVPPAATAMPTAASPASDTIEDKIKLQRLEQIERQNREGKRQEAVEAGRLIDAAIARQTAGREAARLVTLFEGSLSNMATAICAEFKLQQRDVLHLLRGEFRKFRAETASDARARAVAMPAVVDIDLASSQERLADDLKDDE